MAQAECWHITEATRIAMSPDVTWEQMRAAYAHAPFAAEASSAIERAEREGFQPEHLQGVATPVLNGLCINLPFQLTLAEAASGAVVVTATDTVRISA